MLLGAWAAVGGGVWIGGAGRAGALPPGHAALSLPPYVCAVTWWQLQALIWLAPGSLGWFWHSTGSQAERKEWDGWCWRGEPVLSTALLVCSKLKMLVQL